MGEFQGLGDDGGAHLAAGRAHFPQQSQDDRQCRAAVHRVIRDQQARRSRLRSQMRGDRRDLRIIHLLPAATLRLARCDKAVFHLAQQVDHAPRQRAQDAAQQRYP